MPKPTPTEVIVHRLDLQPSLKDSMDAFLIGKTATNALQGVGTILSAAGPALGVLAAWWIADKTLDQVVDEFTGYFEKKGKDIVEDRYGSELSKYQLVMATLESCSDHTDFIAQYVGVIEILKGDGNFNPVYDAVTRFTLKIQSDKTVWMDPANWGKPMAQRWKGFYSVNALMEQVKADALSLGGQANNLPWPANWLWKKATNQ